MQPRDGRLDDCFRLFLTSLEQSRHHHLRYPPLALVRFDYVHQITDSVAHILQQQTMGWLDDTVDLQIQLSIGEMCQST